MKNVTRTILFAALALCLCSMMSSAAGSLEKDFQSPPASARPWVYWFWSNGNITKGGISADLEAMKRVGIGGALIMEVDQGAPVGPVDFMGAKWRELFKYAVGEAQRLGLQINMNDDAGWDGSGGPWITPDQAMQKVVWSETEVTGPQHFDGKLQQADAVADYYHDIAVMAFPTPGSYRIPDIKAKAAFEVGSAGPADQSALPPEMVIDRAGVTDISARMDASGHLLWDVPVGKWTIMRFGHTLTGAQNAPAPTTGRGLECDKLSKEGIDANFNGMMAKLTADVGPAVGKTLVRTHIDSWENGSQNWTKRMREEFKQRRGYDMMPYLPVMSGRVVGSLEISERFLWDLRRTVSELVVENYAGEMQRLAHAHGLQFSCEAYGSPCDNMPYGAMADEPMGEFWTGGGYMEACKGMASTGHIYGKSIVGAEAFTSSDTEKWLDHPAMIKTLGDRAFCEGIQRFVIHRYAMQPWTDDRKPGMTMGPWGLHYERTQTWWELTKPWHRYLARCQYLLRDGMFVADICYLQPETSPQGLGNHERHGYDWDECNVEALLTRMSVKNGRLVLPNGMSYRVLVLSGSPEMTPRLLSKIRDLVAQGATVIGGRPLRSPSLSDYPNCDEQVRRIGAELWGDCDGTRVKEHRFGKGRVVWGMTPEEVLAKSNVGPDFANSQGLHCIHRAMGDTDIYFVASPQSSALATTAQFRVTGKVPELWWPETGRIERAPMYQKSKGGTIVELRLPPSGSVFVVFRKSAVKGPLVTGVTCNDKQVLSTAPTSPAKVTVLKAQYGVLSDPARTRDVREKAQRLIDSGLRSFEVTRMAEGEDPAPFVVKTLVLDCIIDGERTSITETDLDTVNLASSHDRIVPPCDLRSDAGKLKLTAWRSGKFNIANNAKKPIAVSVPQLPSPIAVSGPWTLSVPAQGGPAKEIKLDCLTSWPAIPDIKYFSGTATYRTTFNAPAGFIGKRRVVRLDLGGVQVMADVILNGKDLGVLWKTPFAVNVSAALKPGPNVLEVKVTNLWINRMIGDEQLPDDCDLYAGSVLKSWPKWLEEGKRSPTGRTTFTTWRAWKKNDPLVISGLLGPVTLQAGQEVTVPD